MRQAYYADELLAPSFVSDSFGYYVAGMEHAEIFANGYYIIYDGYQMDEAGLHIVPID